MILVECQCGKTYAIAPQHAGRKVVCRHCGARIRVPGEDASAEAISHAQTPSHDLRINSKCLPSQAMDDGPEVEVRLPALETNEPEYGSYSVIRPCA
jgi:hypothetical protein